MEDDMPKFKEIERGAGTAKWNDANPADTPGEMVTKPGRHPLRSRVNQYADEENERSEKYLRDRGGRERDPRRVPTASQVDSGRTDKSSSKIRFPSRAFRANFDRIFGPLSSRRSHG
jgi:hypothetical protein